jgi:hypothetical protein
MITIVSALIVLLRIGKTNINCLNAIVSDPLEFDFIYIFYNGQRKYIYIFYLQLVTYFIEELMEFEKTKFIFSHVFLVHRNYEEPRWM